MVSPVSTEPDDGTLCSWITSNVKDDSDCFQRSSVLRIILHTGVVSLGL